MYETRQLTILSFGKRAGKIYKLVILNVKIF